MSRIFSLLLFSTLTNYYCQTKRVDNICSTQHIKRVFVGAGEFGILTAVNISRRDSNVTFCEYCRVEIVTCPSCIISLTFRLMNLSCCCGSEFNLFSCNPCRCDYVWVAEPPYYDASGMSFCKVFSAPDLHRRNLGFISKTRTVSVSLFYSRAYLHAFTMEYKSEPNRQIFLGTSQYPLKLNLSTGFISSPFFPAAYPRDLVVEYMMICMRHINFSFLKADVPLDADNTCRVHLMFTDFQLASSSVIEFYDRNRCLGVVSGTSFRPPAIVSTTNALTVRFYASGQNNIGFKGIFSFISENVLKKMTRISTDCGGYVDNFGGSITMMKMVDSQVKLFDCIWLIKPLNNFFNVKSHLYLKVTTFLNFARDAELQIRQGLTSESPILENLRYPIFQNFQEHIVPLESGYYVSFKALFSPRSYLAITYAAFSQNRCFLLSEFLCKNFRCISKKLTCDGFDHCGDNSDESAVCRRERKLNGKWHTNIPNYYFPKATVYSDLEATPVLFMVGLVGLIFFMSSLAVVLYRIKFKNHFQRNLQNQTQSFSDLQDYLSDEISIEDVMVDDPPSYEPPPNYNELVKMFMNRSETFDDFKESDKVV